MKNELFKKVYIKSEKDLPKESGYYTIHRNNVDINITGCEFFMPDNQIAIRHWWKDIDWYLLPIEEQQPMKTAEEIIKKLGFWNPNTDNGMMIKAMEEYAQQCKQQIMLPNNVDSESSLNIYAKRCKEDFTRPSGIAPGWRSCFEWMRSQAKPIDLKDYTEFVWKYIGKHMLNELDTDEVVNEYLKSKH